MIKNILIKGLFFLCLTCAFLACTEEQKSRIPMPVTDLSTESLIPKPLTVTPTNSAFALDKFTAIYTPEGNAGFQDVAEFLADKLYKKINLQVPVNDESLTTVERVIYINQSDSTELNASEAYQLYINQDSIILNANTAEGAFRGIQTLRQLVPDNSNDTLAEQKIWPVASGKITDNPTFSYRSAMLDVARHFFSVEDVKKYIDILSYYKINVLHLHLSDDQGWRIEIKSWPKLTEIGGSTEVGGGEGGFYTQEEFVEIVRYAQERHITIIPEIDMPGHTNAALASYAKLNCDGKATELYTGIEVGFSTLCTDKEITYEFVNDVVRELAEISPGPYFHMGGDESHVTEHDDYI